MSAHAPATPIPVTIVTGFLGAGKTTLLNRLLKAPELADTAVIVNEFGEIGLDHLLVEQGQDRIILLDAGCLCCVLADSLRETLADLYQRRATGAVPPFARVLIETSGLADPAPILESLLRDPLLAGRFAAGAVVCVVDALFADVSLADHREAREQVAMADWLVITKGNASDDLIARLAAINPVAPIVNADTGFDPLALVVERTTWQPRLHRHGHEPDVAAHALRFDRASSWAGIAAWTGHLANRWGTNLLRCKALIALEGSIGPVLIQGVRDRFAVTRLPAWPDADESGRIVVIGRGLDAAVLADGLAWLDAAAGMATSGDAGLPTWCDKEMS